MNIHEENFRVMITIYSPDPPALLCKNDVGRDYILITVKLDGIS